MSRLSLMYWSSGRSELLEVAVTLANAGHHVFGLGNHLQRQVVADGHALGAAFAFAGIDEDGESPSLFPLLLRPVVVLAGLRPLMVEHRSVVFCFDRPQLFVERRLGEHFAQNRRVGTLRDAVHAAGAVVGDVLRNLRGDVAEVAERRSPGGDQRSGDRQVGRQFARAGAVFISQDYPLVEVVDVENGQRDVRIRSVAQGAVGIVVERVAIARFVHR